MDTLKGVALIASLSGFIGICAALVHWHDKTGKIAVEPTRADCTVVGLRVPPPWARSLMASPPMKRQATESSR
jgi:hypothetical protein